MNQREFLEVTRVTCYKRETYRSYKVRLVMLLQLVEKTGVRFFNQ